MTEIGISELLLILVVALIVVGPERLPGLARKAGYWAGRLRQYVAGVRSEIEEQLQADELRQMMRRQEQEMAELRGLLEKSRDEVQGGLEEVNEYLVKATDADPADDGAQGDGSARDAKEAGTNTATAAGTADAAPLPQGFRPASEADMAQVKQPVGNEQKR